MNQEQLEALLAQMGTLGPGDFREETKQEDIPNPASQSNGGLDPNAPITIKGPVTYRTWIKPGTNQRLTVKVNADNTYTKVYGGPDPDIKPTGAAGANVPTSTTEPYIATRLPDGSIKWEPNQNYKPPEAQKGTTQFIKDGNGKTYAVPIDASGKAGTPVDTGLSAESKPGTHVVVDGPTGKQIVQIDANGTARIVYSVAAGDKAEPTDIVINGAHHTKVTTTKPNGSVSVSFIGPDGKPEDKLPSEGEASVSNKPFPEFIAGHVEEALRTGHETVYSDPNLTPAQKEKRFQEMVQVANVVTNEANVQFTNEQNERESQRNAAYNTAHTKLTYMQTGLGQALDFVGKINGNLPKGSDLGGKAFAAIIGIQMLQLSLSGIDKIPTITHRDLSSNAALTAHNQTIATQAAAASQATSQNAGAGVGEPPARANVPAQPGGQSVSGGTPTSAGARPAVTSTTVDPRSIGAPEPPTGQASSDPNLGQSGDPGYNQGGVYMPPSTNLAPYQDSQTEPAVQPASTVADPTVNDPNYQQPQYIPPTYETKPADIPPGEVSQSVSDWPALAGLGSPRSPSSNQQNQQGDMASDAARAAYIKASPPWRLSDDDLTWAKQNGLIDDALSIPGRAA